MTVLRADASRPRALAPLKDHEMPGLKNLNDAPSRRILRNRQDGPAFLCPAFRGRRTQGNSLPNSFYLNLVKQKRELPFLSMSFAPITGTIRPLLS
jgi:hypothetical protein